MMKSILNREFKPTEDAMTPDDIINIQCKLLEEATKGKIIAKVSSYDGPITSYVSRSPLSLSLSALSTSFEDSKIDIQESLGNVSKGDFTFEFFITSPSTPNYKYRVLFLHYEIPFYPALVVLDDAIADELEIECDFKCDTQDTFERALERILSSKKIDGVISALLALVQKEETRRQINRLTVVN